MRWYSQSHQVQPPWSATSDFQDQACGMASERTRGDSRTPYVVKQFAAILEPPTL